MRALPLDESIREIDIYVIVSQISKEFFVWKTTHSRSYVAFINHAHLRNKQTKDLFKRSEQAGIYPQMFILETLQTTEETAYRYCIAWTKYFLEQGMQSLSPQMILDHADDPLEDTQLIYDSIKNAPIENVLSEEHLQVANYKKRDPAAKKKPKQEIKIYLNKKEYKAVQDKADKYGLSMSRYCKNVALDEQIVVAETPSDLELSRYTAEVRESKIILRQILQVIYQNGKYYPADLENIQKMVQRITETQCQLGEYIQENTKELIKLLPK